MCKKLYELSGLTAAEILTLCGEKSYPINIENILAKLGVKYGPLDFTGMEKKFPDVVRRRGEILGAVTLIGDDVNIFYQQGSSENRKRFTLAHELAHCCLDAVSLENRGHVEFRFDRDSSDLKEQAANIFAGELLIPETSLLKLYDSLRAPVSDVMAREFQVSRPVMEARLRYLGMDFYTPVFNKPSA